MTRHWQQLYGKPGRRGYRNREWARKMVEIGLMPSRTGKPGGKGTGENVGHYIRKDGSFYQACKQLLDTGFRISWREIADIETADFGGGAEPDAAWSLSEPEPDPDIGASIIAPAPVRVRRTRRDRSKTKFTCENCPHNAWAKESAKLICGECEVPMIPAELDF
jgi:hypothetical protein